MRCCMIFILLTATLRAEPPKKVDFAHDIIPILKTRCAECHTAGKYKGSVSFDTREDAIKTKAAIPGKSALSEMIRRVTSDDKELRMPPKGEPLTTKQIDLLKAWIDEGFVWEEGFSFRAGTYAAPLKPRRPTLPPVVDGREHPIDRILDAYLAQNKVERPATLDDTAFLRRVYLDLIGLLPTPDETADFLKDTNADKRQRLIRKLLAEDRPFAEHWLSFWNDLLRNDYAGTGFIDGGRKQISGWLYASLLKNKPYDQIVRELISPTPDSEGFIKGIKWRGNVNASQVPELQFAQNISQVFFGINMKCASCHDSFIDRWKLDDAYSLAAITADKPLDIHRCDKPTGAKATARFMFPQLGTIDATQPRVKRLEQLANLVTHPDNGRFTRTIANRLWQRLLGRGIVHPVDVMANRPWSEDLIDHLGITLADQKYDLKKLIEYIVTSQAYQSRPASIKQETTGDEYVYRGPEIRRLSAEQFMDAVWMLTNTGPKAPVAVLPATPFPEACPPERRLVRASVVSSNALLRSLGRPNREQVVTTRPDQLTTLQALDLSNGAFLDDTLNRGAKNLIKEKPKATPEERVEEIYLRLLCRKPTVEERNAALELLGTPVTPEGLADLLWAVLMLPEFQLIR